MVDDVSFIIHQLGQVCFRTSQFHYKLNELFNKIVFKIAFKCLLNAILPELMLQFALAIVVLLRVGFSEGNALLFAEVRQRLQVVLVWRLVRFIECWVRL